MIPNSLKKKDLFIKLVFDINKTSYWFAKIVIFRYELFCICILNIISPCLPETMVMKNIILAD